MEGDKDLRTVVECLRGRLLAERQASRTAIHDSRRLENKLEELEKMVKEEMKLRNKAEKRLKSLKKRLETLENVSLQSQSDKSSSCSEKSEVSSSASSTITFTSSTSESDFKSNVTNSVTSSQQNSTLCDTPKSPHDFRPKSNYQNRCEDEECDVDDSLALALVPNSVSVCKEIESSSVEQVLDSLRYIRETIQSSLEARRMVRVGPN